MTSYTSVREKLVFCLVLEEFVLCCHVGNQLWRDISWAAVALSDSSYLYIIQTQRAVSKAVISASQFTPTCAAASITFILAAMFVASLSLCLIDIAANSAGIGRPPCLFLLTKAMIGQLLLQTREKSRKSKLNCWTIWKCGAVIQQPCRQNKCRHCMFVQTTEMLKLYVSFHYLRSNLTFLYASIFSFMLWKTMV